MNSKDWLSRAANMLNTAGIGTAQLDALVLLEDALHKDRAHLLAHPEIELSPTDQSKLDTQIEQRVQHIPLAFIRGKTEFYGREFKLNKNVLEPRPESETMIDLLKQLPVPKPRIADIGTGSGALAITAKLELPGAQVFACDIDPACLTVARQNTKKQQTAIHIYKSDLLQPNHGPYDVLLCNLPYVPDSYTINQAAMMEPRLAIFGGVDGLGLYRTLFVQIDRLDWQPQYILTESLPFQHHALAAIAAEHGYQLRETDDFIQVFTKKV